MPYRKDASCSTWNECLRRGCFLHKSRYELYDPTILKDGGYQSVLGFDYDWTQAINTSGTQLATFLNTVGLCPGLSIDIEAHSEGVPVSMSALNQMNPNERQNFKRLFSLGVCRA